MVLESSRCSPQTHLSSPSSDHFGAAPALVQETTGNEGQDLQQFQIFNVTEVDNFNPFFKILFSFVFILLQFISNQYCLISFSNFKKKNLFWFCCTSLKVNKPEKLPGEEAVAAAAATAAVCSSGVVL